MTARLVLTDEEKAERLERKREYHKIYMRNYMRVHGHKYAKNPEISEEKSKRQQRWYARKRAQHQHLLQRKLDSTFEQIDSDNMVLDAIKAGKLPKACDCACEDCGVQAGHYRHENYSKPLEVVALCTLCGVKRSLANLANLAKSGCGA